MDGEQSGAIYFFLANSGLTVVTHLMQDVSQTCSNFWGQHVLDLLMIRASTGSAQNCNGQGPLFQWKVLTLGRLWQSQVAGNPNNSGWKRVKSQLVGSSLDPLSLDIIFHKCLPVLQHASHSSHHFWRRTPQLLHKLPRITIALHVLTSTWARTATATTSVYPDSINLSIKYVLPLVGNTTLPAALQTHIHQNECGIIHTLVRGVSADLN